MTPDQRPNPADERALDESAAALRDAGAGEALPPEVRRRALEALWVADAARYESRSARNAKALRRLTALAAVVALACVGGALAVLVRRAVNRPEDQFLHLHVIRNATPPATLPTTGPATAPASTPVQPALPVQPAPIVVRGRVTLKGTAPSRSRIDVSAVRECQAIHPGGLEDESLVVGAGGGIANVVVSLRVEQPEFSPPPTPVAAVLDQKGCQYVPHVLAVRVGQPILVRNSDAFLHNVHALSVDNPAFNFGQPNVDPGRGVGPMTAVERFRVKCDVHPWMGAYVTVFDHPYFAVSGADGAFEIPAPLPDGQYTLVAWHEKLGEMTREFEVTDGAPGALEFQYEMRGTQ
jgi:hypothetical protein